MITRPDYITACVAGLEIYLFGAEKHPGAPVVFVTHGRGGNVTNVFDPCRALAAAGLIAIGVEQRNHGRRLVDARHNTDATANLIYESVLGTVRDISLLIDLLPASLGLATDRTGLTGVSLGGHVTQLAMALDTRLTVGASLIGGGDFRRLMELRAAKYQIPADRFDDFYSPALDAVVQRYDPINRLEQFADRPLLMLNGDADDLVQLECNQRFEAAVRPHYTHPERLRLSVYPGLGHATPPEMWAEARAWLVRWLVEEAV